MLVIDHETIPEPKVRVPGRFKNVGANKMKAMFRGSGYPCSCCGSRHRPRHMGHYVRTSRDIRQGR